MTNDSSISKVRSFRTSLADLAEEIIDNIEVGLLSFRAVAAALPGISG
ncbi:MAG: hypothetical protein ABIT37_04925 [Luteolibacter sp.]